MFLLQHAASSRLRLGMGQLFGVVEQSQANQLAVPVVFSALSLPLGVALALVAAVLALALVALPRPGPDVRVHEAPPVWDLRFRPG